MDQILGAADTVAGGATLSSLLAILKLGAGGFDLESLFQSLIDGLMKFVEFFFASFQG